MWNISLVIWPPAVGHIIGHLTSCCGTYHWSSDLLLWNILHGQLTFLLWNISLVIRPSCCSEPEWPFAGPFSLLSKRRLYVVVFIVLAAHSVGWDFGADLLSCLHTYICTHMHSVLRATRIQKAMFLSSSPVYSIHIGYHTNPVYIYMNMYTQCCLHIYEHVHTVLSTYIWTCTHNPVYIYMNMYTQCCLHIYEHVHTVTLSPNTQKAALWSKWFKSPYSVVILTDLLLAVILAGEVNNAGMGKILAWGSEWCWHGEDPGMGKLYWHGEDPCKVKWIILAWGRSWYGEMNDLGMWKILAWGNDTDMGNILVRGNE